MKQAPVNIKNKRATFDYELVDTYTAGIVLTGTEIKSIRMGKASLVDTFCYFANGELWVKNMHISEYFYGSYNNHSARRERKLLLTKKELDKFINLLTLHTNLITSVVFGIVKSFVSRINNFRCSISIVREGRNSKTYRNVGFFILCQFKLSACNTLAYFFCCGLSLVFTCVW